MAKSGSTYQSILSEVEAGRFQSVYFLMGEESFFIDQLSDKLLNSLLTETEREFDFNLCYGRDVDTPQVIALARQYPMLAKYRVVLVREAQDINDLDKLTVYLEKPMPTTVLIFTYKNGSLDKRKKVYTELEKSAVLFESKKMKEEDLPRWIGETGKSKGISISPATTELLAEYLGSDLARITGEIEKLRLCMPKGEKEVTPELVEKHIGISKEYNDFELQAAIISKDIRKAGKIAGYYAKNPKNNPFIKTLALLGSFFSNLMLYHYLVDKHSPQSATVLGISPYRMREFAKAAQNYNASKTMSVITLIREYDAKVKGFGSKHATESDLMREFLYKLMH